MPTPPYNDTTPADVKAAKVSQILLCKQRFYLRNWLVNEGITGSSLGDTEYPQWPESTDLSRGIG